ncbi:MAG: hypothetical protein UW74_C0004G0004 [Candidatus Giovannonibacteria bacterium GW2011_GWC2_44_8]|uniref:Uncharacterized protein n=1 Tax=Candidatus Giovannonibacteria bacterium GW2011_GWC2_44_8 TaxID=1618657 RepID=A0A0G1ME08_9BACT|nr:MAG: hypothetical protein UW74_C0004G0004 [Candidatus Giovannonibacteria bacterium GW2011_GWC2_44_8]
MAEANRTVRLKVDGWSNSRFGRIEGNLISFEVMWLGCACSTCFARLDAVENRMKGSEVKWQVRDIMIPERVVMPSATLMVEPKEMPERVDSYLSDLLGLQISEVA